MVTGGHTIGTAQLAATASFSGAPASRSKTTSSPLATSTAGISSGRSGQSVSGSRETMASMRSDPGRAGVASALAPRRARKSSGPLAVCASSIQTAPMRSQLNSGDRPVGGSGGSSSARRRRSRSMPLVSCAPTTEPAEVPTTRSVSATGTPPARRPASTPSSQAMPVAPPAPSTSALVTGIGPPSVGPPGRRPWGLEGGCARSIQWSRRKGTIVKELSCRGSASVTLRTENVPMRSLTWDQVVVRRQRRHRLLEPAPPDRLVEVASAVCGIHAQVMASAELSLGLRVAGVTRREVRQELRERRGLVKTYGLRGTVHLFPADELPLWMAALRANQPPEGGDAPDRAGLTPERQDAVIAAIGEALDGRCLTRQALGEELASRLGAWVLEETFPAFGGAWPRWWTAIGEAAVRGVLCFGPNQGNRVTFVRPDQWVSGWHEDLAGSAEPTGDGSVLLLPAFDSYVRGAYPRDQVIPPAAAARAAEGAPARTASSARSSRHRSPSPSARSTGARTCNARP